MTKNCWKSLDLGLFRFVTFLHCYILFLHLALRVEMPTVRDACGWSVEEPSGSVAYAITLAYAILTICYCSGRGGFRECKSKDLSL